MLTNGTMLFLYAETPFHPGASGSLGYVDLPVQRETHTGFPMYQASGLKGVLREKATNGANSNKHIDCIFGPADSGADHAGCISVGDARILLFPVRSLVGVFAWVTCPLVLQRLCRDYRSCFNKKELDLKIPTVSDGKALIDNDRTGICIDGQVVLEEYTFSAVNHSEVGILANWLSRYALPQVEAYEYWRDRLKNQLVIVSDDAFSAFVSYNTMVVNRTKLDDQRKVVATGALWTEENLPPDTLLYAPLFASAPRADKNNVPADIQDATKVLKWLKDRTEGYLLAGGDETVGRGILHAQFYGGES